MAVTEKALLSTVRQMVGHRNSQGEADRYRDKGDGRTDGRSRRVAVWLPDSSVQVGWAVKAQQR